MHRVCLPIAALALAACQTKPAPETLKTPVSLVHAASDEIIRNADADGDGRLTQAEWAAIGGSPVGFAKADANSDGILTRSEVISYLSEDKLKKFIAEYADLNGDSELTRKEFRSPPGMRLLRLDF